jgi:dipeptidyl aminopeptidase/acylaminoacyl peptidase
MPAALPKTSKTECDGGIMRILTLVLLFITAVAGADNNTFKNIDVFELEVAADTQISPDGSRIAYSRVSKDIMTDRSVSNVWIVDANGEHHRPLLSGAQSYNSPRWSPSGDRLAFVTSVGDRGSQIHVRWMDTGQTAMLSNVRGGPSSLAWSPDGKQIAFEMFVKADDASLASPPPAPEGAEWAPPVTVIDQMRYRADGAGYLEHGNSHLFVLSADGGSPRKITSGDRDHGGPLSWSEDGQRIYFAGNLQDEWEHDPMEAEIWSVEVGSGELKQLTDRDGPDFSPTVSPDGSSLAYLGFDDKKMGYHNSNVYVMNLDDGSVEVLTAGFDRSIDDVQWAGSSNRLYVQYDDRGRTNIATLSMRGDVSSVANDVGGVGLGRPYTSGGFSAANNGAYAYTAGRPDRPADVAVGRGSKPPMRLTDLNEDLLGNRDLGAVEEITWQSSVDDLEVQGWLVTPPDFDSSKKYPFILEIHGGPFAAYGPQFSSEIQLYAAAGYVVLYTNPRGSTSYGDAFANEIHHNYPGQDYDDLMSGVDAVIERGFIDEESLFVTGGSGGGVLTAWIVGKTDRFRAAVVAKPVINWTSFSLTSDGAPFYSMYWFEKMPWEDPDAYWARSPLSLVGNVTTPTALLTGEVDYRTPLGQSEQFYQALKIRKVDTILVQIPEASHGIAARPSHLIAKVDNILAWFSKYAKE